MNTKTAKSVKREGKKLNIRKLHSTKNWWNWFGRSMKLRCATCQVNLEDYEIGEHSSNIGWRVHGLVGDLYEIEFAHTTTNNIEYNLNKFIFKIQPRTIHMLFFKFEKWVWYCTAWAHVLKTHHYINSKKICCKAEWEIMYKYSIFLKLLTKSLVIGPITFTSQHNVNSSWHDLIRPHAIMFIKLGIHWIHTLPQLLDASWRCRKFVQASFEKCL